MASVTVVSHRLPAPPEDSNRDYGAAARALMAAMAGRDFTWIGSPGPSPSEPHPWLHAVPLELTDEEVRDYYHGFANSSLWPLLHYFLPHVEHSAHWFECYQRVNARFAEAAAAHAAPGSMVWVHDYHLLLVPAMLRERRPDLRIGFFLHTPFPSYEVFRCHPRRNELLRGMLGADLIGFQTFGYLRHFRSSILRLLGLDSEISNVPQTSHTTGIGVFPIGIDWPTLAKVLQSSAYAGARSELERAFAGKKVVLSVSRLDYIKGIPQKLHAIEIFLDRNPDLREQARFVLVVTPSRELVGPYQDLMQEIDRLSGRINGRYSSLANIPVHFIRRVLPLPQLCAMYALADVGLVTPLIDGLNLVAKEYIACQAEGRGVLILSEFAGAAQELFDALMVNPYHVEEVAEALRSALQRDTDARRERALAMRSDVIQQDARVWAGQFLEALAEERQVQLLTAPPPPDEAVIERLRRRGERKELFLDYDGTLVDIVADPEQAVPAEELREIFDRFNSRSDFEVFIVSGRSPEFMERQLGRHRLNLVAEHGYWFRQAGGSWEKFNPEVDLGWKQTVAGILELYARSTPGSRVEIKTSSVVWHFRGADPEFGGWKARELLGELEAAAANLPIEVRRGKKIIEVRSQQINKGLVLRFVLQTRPYDSALCAGDDQTDESMFVQKLPNLITLKIGAGRTAASFGLPSPAALHRFLARLLE